MFGFSIGRVRGNSMLPRIQPDSYIITIKYPKYLPKRTGQMFYIDHPRYGPIVKTFTSNDNGNLWFCGESSDSISPKEIGSISEKHLIGLVIWVSPPKQRV